MRSLSTTALAALFGSEAGTEVFLVLLELYHPSWTPTTKRFVNNTADIISGANTYTAYPFHAEAPLDSAVDQPRVSLALGDAERELLPLFRTISSSGTKVQATFKEILASAPNTILETWVMEIAAINYNASGIVAQCLFDSVVFESVPGDVMSPPKNPGLFKETE